MFKEALSAVTSSVVGAGKRTANQYRPSNSVVEGGAFERIAQQGIMNMAYRSPVMADMAQTMLKSFQVEVARKEKIRAHVKSEDSAALREAVTKDIGSDASPKKIDTQMESILSKMNATLEKSGAEEAKKTDIFSKYGKHFEDFRKTATPSQPPEAPEKPKDGDGLSGTTATLAKIESNTLRTYNALEVYMSRHNLAGGKGGASPAGGSGNSFIDPLTGMPSVTAAIGHIGGSFLGKVFDDATIDKFANKTRKLLNLDEVEEIIEKKEKKVSPKKGGASEKSITDILGDLNLDLNTSAEAKPVVKGEPLPDSKINTPEEVAAQSAKNADKLENVSKDILNEIRAGNKTVAPTTGVAPQKTSRAATVKEFFKDKIANRNAENVSKKGGGSLADTLTTAKQSASYLPKIPMPTTVPSGGGLGGLGGVGAGAATTATGGAGAAAAGGIGSALLGGLGVIGAGVAGVVAGTTVVNPLIDKGISAATGNETSLGGYIYDKMNDDPMAVMAAKKVSAAPSKTTSSVAALSAEKAKKDATTAATAQQPVIISSGGGSAATAPSSSTNVGLAPSVRNQESTFERVQMQDFWSRSA